jgi:hypothetical protein
MSDKIMDIAVNNPEKVLSALTFVTKNAKQYIKTPRKDGELAVLDTYIIDDVNYATEEYDAFKGGLVVFDPDPSSDTNYHVQIEFSSTFTKSGGIPIWVSLLWKTTEDETGLPPILTQPPAVSGVNTTDLNSYIIGAASVDTMDFPDVVEVPPAPPANTYEVFYDDSLGENGFHIVAVPGSPTSLVLRAYKALPSGTTIHGMLWTVATPNLHINISPGAISVIDSIPYDDYQYRVHRFIATISDDAETDQNLITFTGDFNFQLKESMIFATSPIQVL